MDRGLKKLEKTLQQSQISLRYRNKPGPAEFIPLSLVFMAYLITTLPGGYAERGSLILLFIPIAIFVQ